MKDHENILDSGETYKDPNRDPSDFMSPLEIQDEKIKKVNWERLVFGKGQLTHELYSSEWALRFSIPQYPFFLIALTWVIALLLMALTGWPYLLIILGAAAFLTRHILSKFTSSPITFDKETGLCWKGTSLFGNQREKVIGLEAIFAVQILQEFVLGDVSKGQYSYEINLILNDNSRMNITDHGNKNQAYQEAEMLAKFLSVPLYHIGINGPIKVAYHEK